MTEPTSTPRPTTRADAITMLTAAGQRYELATVSVHGTPQRWFVHGPASLRAMYADAVSDETFTVFGDERRTFAEHWSDAARIGRVLVDTYGIAPGDRVAISMRNYPEWMTAFVAITSVGAIAVAMNSLWQPDEMAYALVDSGARVLLADQERVDRFEQQPVDGVDVIAVRPDRTVGHPVLDDLYDSLETAWGEAISWWRDNFGPEQSAVGIGVEVSTASGDWRTLRHPGV